MNKLAAVVPLLLATVMMIAMPSDAEARRMGYGGSIGRQYSVPQRSATPPASAPRQTTDSSAAAAPRQGGASRWFGPVAGLLAGGLLASLFMGGGFQGIQLMDIVVIMAVAFAIFLAFRALRPRQAPALLRTAEGPMFGQDAIPPGAGVDGAQSGGAAMGEAPAWFDAQGFLKNARTHFIRLQAAWDKGDMKDIAEYTTPEMYASLQAERLSHGSEPNFTEVMYLDTELLGVQRDGDKVVVSIRFFGGIREEQNGPTQEFSEVWHVVHAWESAAGDWYLAGIRQQG